MFWASNWMVSFLEYCYVINTDLIEDDNDYGQFVELD